ncbi:DEKNAAC104035 [Brettanomyces naardenensis]|uniref:DEKNAAC104035 n=1 Tax=Brettanomyces naardenensis TaxID=13370 RepID=A0A448YQ88_BRENA|nr:DEKNAAC104035 [Brettanomyces naardenensis]
MAFKDLPSILRKEITWGKSADEIAGEGEGLNITVDGKETFIHEDVIAPSGKKSYWPIFTAGAGLFSDGYVNNSISTVSTCLSIIYGKQYTHSNALKNVSSIVFVGTVVGQLSFGVFSDYISRKTGMLVSSAGLILFAILCAGAWGVGTQACYGCNAGGLFTALTIYRFFLGIFIGAEYPTGSAACAEASALLPAGKRNRWFAWFTDFMIDLGFVISAFVPMVMLWICGPKNLQPVWRVTLGIGAIFPCSLFIMRLYFAEGEQFKKLNFKKATVPWLLVLRFYWFRLLIVAIIWWIYDFSSYAFGIYSAPILNTIIPDGDLYKTFGWNVVFNLFYMPGAFLGAIAADYIGPRLTLASGVFAQAIIGYAMAGSYATLSKHVAGFTVVYGIFMTLGEFGPGDNIGLLAAKTSATPIRGIYYGMAAAFGKIGAFCGTYAFPSFQEHYPGIKGYQVPFYLASSLAAFAGLLALFCLPPVDQEAMQREDLKFLQFLSANGFDVTQLGEGSFGSAVKPLEETVHVEDNKTAKEDESA